MPLRPAFLLRGGTTTNVSIHACPGAWPVNNWKLATAAARAAFVSLARSHKHLGDALATICYLPFGMDAPNPGQLGNAALQKALLRNAIYSLAEPRCLRRAECANQGYRRLN